MTHPFERSGLGKAPFRYVGHAELLYQACPGAPIQPGGSCDYCGTGIRDAFYIKSADGKRFKVGCDCVRKVYAEYKTQDSFDGVVIAVNKAKAKLAKANKQTRVRFAIEAFEADKTMFTNEPHPMDWARAKGLTLRDYAVWMLANSGLTGKIKITREIEAALKQREG